eukprot:1155792-Pelagomonas_calceolata.AAC.1
MAEVLCLSNHCAFSLHFFCNDIISVQGLQITKNQTLQTATLCNQAWPAWCWPTYAPKGMYKNMLVLSCPGSCIEGIQPSCSPGHLYTSKGIQGCEIDALNGEVGSCSRCPPPAQVAMQCECRACLLRPATFSLCLVICVSSLHCLSPGSQGLPNCCVQGSNIGCRSMSSKAAARARADLLMFVSMFISIVRVVVTIGQMSTLLFLGMHVPAHCVVAHKLTPHVHAHVSGWDAVRAELCCDQSFQWAGGAD